MIEKIVPEIVRSYLSSIEKYGMRNHSPVEWVSILTEEVGEVARAAKQYHFQKDYNTNGDQEQPAQALQNYRDELIQVASVALSAIEALDRVNQSHFRNIEDDTLKTTPLFI